MRHPAYRRTQVLWPLWVLLPGSTAAVVGTELSSRASAQSPGALVVAAVVGVGLLALALLGRFTVEVGDGRVEWRFGFLGWPRWSIALADVAAVDTTRTGWLDGWGIRRTRRGWLYNAAGFGAVELRMRDGRAILLGSDEPERLCGFIAARLDGAG